MLLTLLVQLGVSHIRAGGVEGFLAQQAYSFATSAVLHKAMQQLGCSDQLASCAPLVIIPLVFLEYLGARTEGSHSAECF